MTWVSTRALVEGKEPGYGAGCGGVAIFPCAAGLCSFGAPELFKRHFLMGPASAPAPSVRLVCIGGVWGSAAAALPQAIAFSQEITLALLSQLISCKAHE